MTQIIAPLYGRAMDAANKARYHRDNPKILESEWNKAKAIIWKRGVVIAEPDGRYIPVQEKWLLAQLRPFVECRKIAYDTRLQHCYYFAKQNAAGPPIIVSRSRVAVWQKWTEDSK